MHKLEPKLTADLVQGMSDYYRDRVRQGGILSNQFIKFVSQVIISHIT